MKITSYNVNGIRSALTKGLIDWIQEDQSDVYLFQEIKANEQDIPTDLFTALGYEAHWFSAQKKGYSGVGLLSKIKPAAVVKGCGIAQADAEGRVIQAQIAGVHIVNTYFPSGSSGDERQDYKMVFLNDYLAWMQANAFLEKPLVVAGDYNICHKPIDIHDPVGNKNSSGFLPEERAWMDTFFEAGMHDTFRMKNLDPHHYSWWSFRANARNNNKGWRIDYINVSNALADKVQAARILPDVKHSDHCPVQLELHNL